MKKFELGEILMTCGIAERRTGMNIIMYVNHLKKKECHCGLPEFYKLIAANIGYDVTENTRYDCRKIQCTEEVEKEIRAYYYENGYTPEQFGCLWLSFGPKANLADFIKPCVYRVRVETGAIYEEGEKKND